MEFTYGTISYHDPAYSEWDLHDYRVMAQASPGLTDAVRQPFVYRILGPFIAGILPFSIDDSFLILSILSGLMLSLLFYLYVSASGIEPMGAAVATLLLIFNKYFYGFPIWNYFQVNDILALIEIVLLMWSMTSQKWLLFSIVLCFGALTKETPLIMIPVAFVYLIDAHCLKTKWNQVLGAVLPACITAVALRILLHAEAGNNLPEAFMAYAGKLMLPETWFRVLINSFIPFSLVPLLFIESTRMYFRTRKYAVVYLMLVAISTFFGYNNERLMAPAFIVFYPLVAAIIQERVSHSTSGMLLIVAMAVISGIHHTYARFPLPREVTVIISLLAFGVVTISMVYYRIRSGRSQRTSG